MITELINERLIRMELCATDKKEVLSELVSVLADNGRLHDPKQFLADIYAREELGNTGFEEGIAIPHAKSTAVKIPSVVIGVSRNGIDYGADDGLPSKLFFMIASPEGEASHHIGVLAELSSKLIEEGFIARFLAATDEQQALQLLLEKNDPIAIKNRDNGFLIGVTGCP
ncbi:MAG: PTS sugar transporter subunit IIA, partial [Plesiomonas sp.]